MIKITIILTEQTEPLRVGIRRNIFSESGSVLEKLTAHAILHATERTVNDIWCDPTGGWEQHTKENDSD